VSAGGLVLRAAAHAAACCKHLSLALYAATSARKAGATNRAHPTPPLTSVKGAVNGALDGVAPPKLLAHRQDGHRDRRTVYAAYERRARC